MKCPVCQKDIFLDPEHWGLRGQAKCTVRAFATDEEVELLALTWELDEIPKSAIINQKPMVVNVTLAALEPFLRKLRGG